MVTGILTSILTGVAVLGGCSTGSGPPAGATGTSASAPTAGPLPTVWALLDQAEAAKAKVVVRCMERKGFTVHPESAGKQGPQRAADGYPYRPGPPADAERDGYGLRRPATETPKAPSSPAAYDRLPKAERDRYQAALGGWTQFTLSDGSQVRLRRGGCDEEALTGLFGDVQQYFRLVAVPGRITSEVRAGTDADPRSVAATKAWSACLAAAGFPGLESVDDAEALATSYHWPRGGPPVSFEEAKQKEIRLAVADAGCAASSNVDGTLRTVWTERNRDYLAAHDADLVALRDLLDAALVRAQRILGG